jgi:hypothetical protein
LVDLEDDEFGTRDCLFGDACRISEERGRMLILLHSFCLPAILVSLVKVRKKIDGEREKY